MYLPPYGHPLLDARDEYASHTACIPCSPAQKNHAVTVASKHAIDLGLSQLFLSQVLSTHPFRNGICNLWDDLLGGKCYTEDSKQQEHLGEQLVAELRAEFNYISPSEQSMMLDLASFFLRSLETLDLSQCTSLAELPESLGAFKCLQELRINGCTALATLPDSLGLLVKLTALHLQSCHSLVALPESLGQLFRLKTLDLSWCTSLTALPSLLEELTGLQQIDLTGCSVNAMELPIFLRHTVRFTGSLASTPLLARKLK